MDPQRDCVRGGRGGGVRNVGVGGLMREGPALTETGEQAPRVTAEGVTRVTPTYKASL